MHRQSCDQRRADAMESGVKNEVFAVNPLSKVEKLYTEGHQRILTPEECRTLLRESDALFRRILLMFRLTGFSFPYSFQ